MEKNKEKKEKKEREKEKKGREKKGNDGRSTVLSLISDVSTIEVRRVES